MTNKNFELNTTNLSNNNKILTLFSSPLLLYKINKTKKNSVTLKPSLNKDLCLNQTNIDTQSANVNLKTINSSFILKFHLTNLQEFNKKTKLFTPILNNENLNLTSFASRTIESREYLTEYKLLSLIPKVKIVFIKEVITKFRTILGTASIGSTASASASPSPSPSIFKNNGITNPTISHTHKGTSVKPLSANIFDGSGKSGQGNLYKSNEIKIEQTLKSLVAGSTKNFEFKIDSINPNSNPVEDFYVANDKPVINQFIKNMTIFNIRKKGLLLKYANILGFNFNYEKNNLFLNITKFLETVFKSMNCLISKPVFVITPDKVTIQLFYYLCIPKNKVFKWYQFLKKRQNKQRELKSKMNKINNLGAYLNIKSKPQLKNSLGLRLQEFKQKNYLYNKKVRIPWFIKKALIKFSNKNSGIDASIKLKNLNRSNLAKNFPNKFQIICKILSLLFKKPVEFDLIRLHHPYHDNNILVNLLALIISKKNIRLAVSKIFEKKVVKKLNHKKDTKNNFNPAFISGLKVKVGGRLMREPIVPRLTVKKMERGATASGKINFLDTARITKKNRKGAFSISISSGQNFF